MLRSLYIGLALSFFAPLLAAQTGTGLKGEYFDNLNLTNLKRVRIDANINFNWGTGSPVEGMEPDTFSVRWTGFIVPRYSESYTFYTESDDGARLWIDDRLIIDDWADHGLEERSGRITLSAGQKVSIRLEYFDRAGRAQARLSWSSQRQTRQTVPQSQLYPSLPDPTPTATPRPTPTATPTPTPTPRPTPFPTPTPRRTGLNGDYFNDRNFTQLIASRMDQTVDFSWGLASPLVGLRPDNFSIRWTGLIEPKFSELYTFTVQSDDGARLWIDGHLIIDNWTGQKSEATGSIRVNRGEAYSIKLEYYDTTGSASVRLLWSSPQQPLEVINRFYQNESGNISPFMPVITEPSHDGHILSPSDVHMETTPFSDINSWDLHLCTDWEIWTISPVEIVWSAHCAQGMERSHTHLADGTFLNSHAGQKELLYNRDYRLRVRHRDNSLKLNEWSPWSERHFRTADPPRPGTDQAWTVMQPGYVVDVVARGFQLPVNIAFHPRPSLAPGAPFFYVAELYGTIKVVTRDGTVKIFARELLNFEPNSKFPGSGEQGLVGLVVDDLTGDLYASLLYDVTGNRFPRVIRLRTSDGIKASAQEIVLDMFGEALGPSHQISNLTIGPDRKLYVHIGDGFDFVSSANLNSFKGKIVRLNLDGSAPSDNPFYNLTDGISARDYIYASGFRNPFGGAWKISGKILYAAENGPAIDRIVKVSRGEDYGWNGDQDSLTGKAAFVWSPAVAPVNIEFLQKEHFNGSGFPVSKMGHAFVTESGPTWAAGPQLRGKAITEFIFGRDGHVVSGPIKLVEYTGRGRGSVAALSAGPDGLYFSDLYKDLNYLSAVDQGANILRIRYVGETTRAGNGLRGDYFDLKNLTQLKATRIDPQIKFRWSTDTPPEGIAPNYYSIRWTGQVLPEYSETYTFHTISDDGVRVWVNGNLLIDNWTDHGDTENSGSIDLVSGLKYDIKIEYYNGEHGAAIELLWSSPSRPKETIPQSRLFSYN